MTPTVLRRSGAECSRRPFARTAATILGAAACIVSTLTIDAAHASAPPGVDPSDAEPLTERVHLTFGNLQSVNVLPAYVAADRGYFADENLEVEFVPSAGSAELIPLLGTGQVDVGFAGPTLGMMNNIINGIDVRYVASGGLPVPGGPNATFIAKVDGPIGDIPDLAGRRVATAGGLSGQSGYMLSRLLEPYGMSIDDVEVVDLNFADGLAALENGAVDASLALGVNALELEAAGTHFQIGDIDAVLADGPGTGIVFGSNLLVGNRQAGVALLRALIRATADLQGDYAHEPWVVELLSEQLGLPPDAIRRQLTVAPRFAPNLAISPNFYLGMQEYFIERGLLETSVGAEVSQVFDDSFRQLALDTVDLAASPGTTD